MKQWSLCFRVWHWLMAFVIFGLLATVLLRKTFLSWRANSELIVSKLSSFGMSITHDQAVSLAKAIRAPMWEWHIILGYILVALVVYRIILVFTHSGIQNYTNFDTKDLHQKAVSAVYLLFYGIIIIMSISGLLLTFNDKLGLSENFEHTIKELHEFLFNGIWIYTIIHIAGVIIAENKDEKGITSTMIGK
ncbi:MAG: cytochrome b/b6 domain-containing protein [Campylobacterales bacterium]|nr:cytochrome b/b6 domain-containing protein [Campylobacterales bacterium]